MMFGNGEYDDVTRIFDGCYVIMYDTRDLFFFFFWILSIAQALFLHLDGSVS